MQQTKTNNNRNNHQVNTQFDQNKKEYGRTPKRVKTNTIKKECEELNNYEL
jgi:hypothetical protein